MEAVNQLREILPDAASDLKLNLQTVLETSSLAEEQRWCVAAACAIASRNPKLREAVLSDAKKVLPEVALEDARVAAVIMGMNNVYYRFRHVVGKDEYKTLPARLRMNRIARPSDKAVFELACLAVSSINGCEACMRSHEETVLKHGLNEENVQDAVRIASVMHGVAVALESV